MLCIKIHKQESGLFKRREWLRSECEWNSWMLLSYQRRKAFESNDLMLKNVFLLFDKRLQEFTLTFSPRISILCARDLLVRLIVVKTDLEGLFRLKRFYFERFSGRDERFFRPGEIPGERLLLHIKKLAKKRILQIKAPDKIARNACANY